MNLFAKAKTWLPSMMLAAAGIGAVTYTRGAVSVAVEPWKGRTAQPSQQEKAARLEWSADDYLFRLADLEAAFAAAGSTYGEPAIGDTITETINGAACVFRAMPPENGEQVFTYADTGRAIVAIHAKQVS